MSETKNKCQMAADFITDSWDTSNVGPVTFEVCKAHGTYQYLATAEPAISGWLLETKDKWLETYSKLRVMTPMTPADSEALEKALADVANDRINVAELDKERRKKLYECIDNYVSAAGGFDTFSPLFDGENQCAICLKENADGEPLFFTWQGGHNVCRPCWESNPSYPRDLAASAGV